MSANVDDEITGLEGLGVSVQSQQQLESEIIGQISEELQKKEQEHVVKQVRKENKKRNGEVKTENLKRKEEKKEGRKIFICFVLISCLVIYYLN